MFKETSNIEDKLRSFFDICDVSKSGSISSTQLYDLLKKNIIYSGEKLELKRISNNYLLIISYLDI